MDGLDTPLEVDTKIANVLLGLAAEAFVAAQLASRNASIASGGLPSLALLARARPVADMQTTDPSPSGHAASLRCHPPSRRAGGE